MYNFKTYSLINENAIAFTYRILQKLDFFTSEKTNEQFKKDVKPSFEIIYKDAILLVDKTKRVCSKENVQIDFEDKQIKNIISAKARDIALTTYQTFIEDNMDIELHKIRLLELFEKTFLDVFKKSIND